LGFAARAFASAAPTIVDGACMSAMGGDASHQPIVLHLNF
jgi:hypothetical protein